MSKIIDRNVNYSNHGSKFIFYITQDYFNARVTVYSFGHLGVQITCTWWTKKVLTIIVLYIPMYDAFVNTLEVLIFPDFTKFSQCGNN